MRFAAILLTGLLVGLNLNAGAMTEADRHAAYLERVHEVIEWRADRVDVDEPSSGGLGEISAKLALGEDLDWASERLIEVLEEPGGDMFWMFPATSVAFLGRDQLSSEAMQAMHRAWRDYMPMRGDTENHWAMYYASLYLMAELWPNKDGSEWFTGKSSQENLAEAREYLIWWMDLTTSIGQGEYDPTHYIGEYLIPMLYLAVWAEDPAMRLRGQMMVDYIAADFAIETLDGIYVGAHSRTDDRQVLEKWNGLSSFFAWLFFGNTPPPANYGGWGSYFAIAAGHYQLPEVIYRIATDRSEPYLHRELKRTRERWRHADYRFARVYKTTYMTRDYAIGSDQGGLLQPIQQHSWDLTWAVDDPRGVHNTIFSLNPHWSEKEMQMYFAEYPDFMPEAVTKQAKPTYMAEDTFLGGSPYEQVYQQDDTIIALYDIPEGAHHEHINGFFSKDLSRLEEDAVGWIFAQGGNTYIAYYPLANYEWRPLENGGKRLFSPHRKNGTILQAASADAFESWEAFKRAVRALPLETRREPTPRVAFTTLRGREVVFEFDKVPVVDGEPVNYADWPLFESPYLHAEPHSRKLRMTHGSLERVLDFDQLKIKDRVHEAEREPFRIDAIRPVGDSDESLYPRPEQQ